MPSTAAPPSPGSTPLLAVNGLHVSLPTARGPAHALRSIDFTLARGETLGIVGESGSGKSMLALALPGLLPEGAHASGSIRLGGQELLGLPERALQGLRGRRIGMVFQEPMTALNPLHTVGDQVAEPLRLHQRLGRQAARAVAIELLERVGIAQAAERIDAYPHQFSGGQRQRIGIAMALAAGPDLLIADEPTSALDVTVQQQILQLLRSLVVERGMALILISHDLAVVARAADRVLVMYGGAVVEAGATHDVFARPAHPYTRGLLAARPVPDAPRGTRLATIAGQVPALADLPTGCPFAGRCGWTIAACETALPPALPVAAAGTTGAAPAQASTALATSAATGTPQPAHVARCIRMADLPPAGLGAARPTSASALAPATGAQSS